MKKILLGLLLSTASIAGAIRTDTIEQNLGSFGLRNFIKNPGAEKNITIGITNSSSIVTRGTTTPIEGVAEYSIDATATAQNVDWAVNTLDQGLKNNNCEARAVIEGDASLYTANVLINSVVVATLTLSNYTNPQAISLNFPCGDLSNQPSFRIASTGNGAVILVDSVYIGRATNINSATVNTDWLAYTPTFTSFGTVSASSVYWRRQGDSMQIYGTFTIGTPSAGVAMVSLPSGYSLAASVTVKSIVGTMVATDAGTVYGTTLAEIATPTALLFGRQVSGASGYTSNANGDAIVSPGGKVSFFATVPIAGWTGQDVVRVDNANTDWASYTPTFVNFGTVTNINYMWRRVGDSVEIQGIATPGTTAAAVGTISLPSGLVVGKIPASISGSYSLVGYYASNSNLSAPSIIAQYGDTVLSLGIMGSAASGLTPINGANISNNTTFSIFAKVPIQGWTNNQNAPLLVGSVTSSTLGLERIERAYLVNNTSTCSVSSQSGSWVSSCTRNSTGDISMPFTGSPFSARPSCVITGTDGTTGPTVTAQTRILTTSTSGLTNIQTFNASGSLTDGSLSVMCMGPK